jgi:hypothetical protein
MTWRMTGQWLDLCSCKMLCRCIFGPAEPDQGWCSAGIVCAITEGTADGVDLHGTTVAVALDLPKDFANGDATARVYLDEGATPDQRRELEAIFTGQKGGVWSAVARLVTTWLPAQVGRITLQDGERPAATVGTIAQVTLRPVTTDDGRRARLLNGPAFGAFGLDSNDLANSEGSQWADPDMRPWQGGGFGSTTTFTWSG